MSSPAATAPITASHVAGIVASRTPQDLAGDETFWQRISQLFARPADFTHLEYGYFQPPALRTLEAEIDLLRTLAIRASHYKRGETDALQQRARESLAEVVGVPVGEIAILRNATEALNVLIQGVPLERGDEILHSDQDYSSMVEALEQRAERDGMVLRAVKLPPSDATDDEIVQSFAAAMTPRTRLIFVTHVINFTGRILPAKQLSRLAHAHGAQVIIDAAHSLAHLDFSIPELECDYLGASLQKWMAAPIGLSLLHCRREHIARMRPLLADTRLAADDILKLAHIGNRPDSAFAGLLEAIQLQRAIGRSHKFARLHRLQRRWTDALEREAGVHLLAPRNPAQHGAIGSFRIDGAGTKDVAAYLMDEHRVFVAAMDHPVVPGVRVVPSLATVEADIDRLVEAVRAAARHFRNPR